MAFTTTTLAAACAVTDTQITVTSASGFAPNQFVKVDDEFMKIVSSYNGVNTIIQVLRGQNATTVTAHPASAKAETDAVTATDWAASGASVIPAYPLAGRARRVTSYSASGAITVPTAGVDQVAILNGTNALAMTLAAPTTDMDGTILIVIANGAAAHTLSVPTGFGIAGTTGYTKLTAAAGGQNSIMLMAAQTAWVPLPSLIAGTATNLSVTIT